MRVEDFYGSACKTKQELQSLITEPTRTLVLRKAVVKFCTLYKEGNKGILKEIEALLRSEYKPSWFSLDWIMESRIKDDLHCFERFLNWLTNAPCIEANIRTKVELGKGELSSRADLIVEINGKVTALTIHAKTADKSPLGKQTHTNSKKDLYALVNKTALEETYPMLRTGLIYLFNEEDATGDIKGFLVNNTRKSNAFLESYGDFYEDRVFQREYAMNLIKEVTRERKAPDCYNCSSKDLCAKQTVKNMNTKRVAISDSSYEMPEFTKAQKEVIGFKDGPMLVCAGPGSGKTATLVGRIEKLIKEGVPPETILVVTFTREAAGELLKRCQSFCRSDEHPEIMTLNALGNKILKDNPEYLGREVKVLSNLDKFGIIKNLLSDFPVMKGFSYNVLKGNRGLLQTLDRRMSEYLKDKEAYRKKHECDKNFERFTAAYLAAVKSRGYITFDEQITLALKLIKENPKTMDFSKRYKYVMVDEYQDVNAEQVELVYTIASHGNLVVVGDDDQSIYGFRGGSNKYMISFERDFPSAKKVVLKENFRSTGSLIGAAQQLIGKNRNRINKPVSCVRGAGKEPEYISEISPGTIDSLVKTLTGSGYKLSDIAVLASKNATLEELEKEVKVPSVLGKAYLRDDPIFRLILGSLGLHYNGMSEEVLLSMLITLDATPENPIRETLKAYPNIFKGRYEKNVEEPFYKALRFINTMLKRIEGGCSAAYLVDYVCQTLDADESMAERALSTLVEKNHLKDTRRLYEHMAGMVALEDDTRIEPDTENAVLFITSHESKGMEWRAVIMVDDYKEDHSEETTRLEYVAMTRAKDMLYVLTKQGGREAVA